MHAGRIRLSRQRCADLDGDLEADCMALAAWPCDRRQYYAHPVENPRRLRKARPNRPGASVTAIYRWHTKMWVSSHFQCDTPLSAVPESPYYVSPVGARWHGVAPWGRCAIVMGGSLSSERSVIPHCCLTGVEGEHVDEPCIAWSICPCHHLTSLASNEYCPIGHVLPKHNSI